MHPTSFLVNLLDFEVTEHKCCFVLSVSMVWFIYCCILFGVLSVIYSLRHTHRLEHVVQQLQDRQASILDTDSDSESDSDTKFKELDKKVNQLYKVVYNFKRENSKPKTAVKAIQTDPQGAVA